MCNIDSINVHMAIEVEAPEDLSRGLVPGGLVAGVARDNSCVCQVGGVSLCSSERLAGA